MTLKMKPQSDVGPMLMHGLLTLTEAANVKQATRDAAARKVREVCIIREKLDSYEKNLYHTNFC